MSGFCYNVLALIPSGSGFTIANAVEAFIADGQSASYAVSSTGGSGGFRVVFADGWAIVAWLEDTVEIADENQQIIEVFGAPPSVGANVTMECASRLSVWSDDDSEMMNAHLFEEYIDFIKERLGLHIFDSVQGIWR